MPLHLEIVTPEARTFSGEVDTVVVPGVEGEAGLLPGHAPLVSAIQPGELSYVSKGESHHLAIGEGFVEISNDRVSVITDLAIGDADIDEGAVEEALSRAEAAIKDKDVGDEDYAATQAAIAKSMAQLNLKRRRKRV